MAMMLKNAVEDRRDSGSERHLKLNLFGRFSLLDNDAEIALPSTRERALIAYLAMHAGRFQARDKLAALLWPDRSSEQARHSLRQAMYVVRKALGSDGASIMVSGNGGLAVDPTLVEVDVTNFEHLANEFVAADLLEAAAYYSGEFLDDVSLESQEFEDWVIRERVRLHETACAIQARLVQVRIDEGDIASALEASRRLLELDPLREEAHRHVMQLLAISGRRSAALEHYRDYTQTLRNELGAEPDMETRMLYQELRAQGMRNDPDFDAEADVAPVLEPSARRFGRPSIAVMTFENLDTEGAGGRVHEGIAENIVFALGRFRSLDVVVRSTNISYKGSDAPISGVADELGARYLIQGSVRAVNGRIRITAALIDGPNERLLWSERFDAKIGDIFEVEDEIAAAVIAKIYPRVLSAEADFAAREDVGIHDSWGYLMRARSHLWRFNRADVGHARSLLHSAIESDPDNSLALTDLAGIHLVEAIYGWSESPAETIGLAYKTAQRSLALESEDAWTHVVLGAIEVCMNRHDDGIRRIENAVELNPYLASAHGFLGLARALAGDTVLAIEAAERAMRLSPRDQFLFVWFLALACAAFVDERYADTVTWARRIIQERPDFPSGYRLLAASYGQMGDVAQARSVVADILRLVPGQSLVSMQQQLPYRDPTVVQRFIDGLRMGDLPAC